jgi:predicted transcriptional regulator of viral defense system
MTQALRLLGEYAADQWGLVTAAQAAGLGVPRVTLTRLTAAGVLEHVLHGVYGVPAALSSANLTEKAVWLRLDPSRPAWQRHPLDGSGGVVSHRSAAAVHDLGDVIPDVVELTVPRRRTTRDRGVRLRLGSLSPGDVERVDGLPVTTAERTVLDLLADHMDGGHIGGVLADALRRRLVDLDRLADHAQRYAARYGVTSGPHRGRQLLDQFLDEAGYDGADEPERRLASLARQLASLDADQMQGLSEALRHIRDGGQR